ncbi:hypothetical protein BKA62DRAFT_768095 [Auriculariales sp. MPI-PUGE-AT-0066]|nr:hypothetical protein BKA62DRAFT_768095 [Auriculariales sp. MPI-PUGE-AT-0066]
MHLHTRPKISPTGSSGSASSGSSSAGSAAAVTAVSSASSATTTATRTSYSNPTFYSTQTRRRVAEMVDGGLQPLPLATFSALTNTEQRWAESRQGSRATSPTAHEHAPGTNSALAAGVKGVEGVRASLIESVRGRRSSADGGQPIPRKAAAAPAPPPQRQHLSPRAVATLSTPLAYPSSSERDRPASPRARHAGATGARRGRSNDSANHSGSDSRTSASDRDHPRTPLQLPSRVPDVLSQKSDEDDDDDVDSAGSGKDAHDWLIKHYTFAKHAPAPAAPTPAAPANSRKRARERDSLSPPQYQYHPTTITPQQQQQQPQSMSSVDDDLLDLVDGPRRPDDVGSEILDLEHGSGEVGGRYERFEREESGQPPGSSSGASLVNPAPSSSSAYLSVDEPGSSRAKPAKRARGGAKRKRSVTAGRSRSASVVSNDAMDVDVEVDGELAEALGLHGGGGGGSGRSGSVEYGYDSSGGPSKAGTPSPVKGGNGRKRRAGAAAAAAAAAELYCVCQTPYDEGRFMVACDRCDGWYHPHCVDVADTEVDLIDQFVCPVCQAGDPSLSTSFKVRCLRGTYAMQRQDAQRRGERGWTPANDFNPEDIGYVLVCLAAARVPVSKYCSDACAAMHVQDMLAVYGKRLGEARGDAEGWEVDTWNAVRAAGKVEGKTRRIDGREDDPQRPKVEAEETESIDPAARAGLRVGHPRLGSASAAQLHTLHALLAEIVAQHDTVQRGLALVEARERFIQLAARRSDTRETCGWDERLLMSDAEWEAFVMERERDGEDVGDDAEESENSLCTGRRKCDRHVGWQKLRTAEVEIELSVKVELLNRLATRDREIRRAIEELEPPALVVEPAEKSSRGSQRKRKYKD